MFVHAIQVTDNNFVAYRNLGAVLVTVPGRAAEAVSAFTAEVRIRPNSAQAHTDLGTALGIMGRRPDAIREYETALRIDPNYAQAHNKLGGVWEDLGDLFLEGAAEYNRQCAPIPSMRKGT